AASSAILPRTIDPHPSKVGAANTDSASKLSSYLRSTTLGSTSGLTAGAAGLCLLAATGIPETSLAFDDDTATPIQHLVVLFQENVSFDHYFATYPVALNSPGEPFFRAREDTPSVNGLGTLVDGHPDGVLLTDNPNANNPA